MIIKDRDDYVREFLEFLNTDLDDVDCYPAMSEEGSLVFGISHAVDIWFSRDAKRWVVEEHDAAICLACVKCSVCDQLPRVSGAERELATVIWDDIYLKVCSTCASSAAHLAAAAARSKAALADDPWADDPTPF